MVLVAVPMLSQRASAAIVAGSDFEPTVYPGDSIPWDFPSAIQYGMSGNSFSSNATYSGNGENYRVAEDLDFVYCLTNNPSTLNEDYMEADEYMCVVQYAGKMKEMTSFFSYKVNGLRPGSKFTVTIEYYVLNTETDTKKLFGYTYTPTVDFKACINPNEYGSNEAYDAGGGSVNVACKEFQTKQTVTLKGVVAAGESTIDINLLYGYNGKAEGIALGISNIIVDGTPDPKIASSQGLEACKGEQTLLSLDKDYNAKKYSWQHRVGGSWEEIGTSKNLLYEMSQDETFRCLVDGVESNELEVKAIVCCEMNGKPASRKTLLWETFGHFSDPHTYIDRDGNESTTPAAWPAYRADVSYDLPGNQFDDGSGAKCTSCKAGLVADGAINDGFYAIVTPTANGYYTSQSIYQTANWMKAVTTDHTSLITGEKNGGALFINVDYFFTGVVFEAEFPNVCTGKTVFYETWIANLSGGTSTNPIVTVNIVDAETGELLAQEKDVEAVQGKGWYGIKGSFLLDGTGTKNVKLQVLSTNGSHSTSNDSYWRNGNDLIIDDIKFMVCSPPSLEAYSDINTFAKDSTICSDMDFTVECPTSTLLNDFFGKNQKYLFQYSGDKGKNWKNISGLEADSKYVINTGDYAEDVMQFRVIVATPDVLSDFLAQPNGADFEDNCRNYSITEPFTITRAGDLDFGATFNTAACQDDKVDLKAPAVAAELNSWWWTEED